MREINVSLRDIARAIEGKEDLLKIISAFYLENEYGYEILDMEDDLSDVNDTIRDNESLSIAICNTLAKCDEEYDEEDYDSDDNYDEEDYCEDEEDYCDDEEDEDETFNYWENYNNCNCGVCDRCTQKLIEKNRKRNEEVLNSYM